MQARSRRATIAHRPPMGRPSADHMKGIGLDPIVGQTASGRAATGTARHREPGHRGKATGPEAGAVMVAEQPNDLAATPTPPTARGRGTTVQTPMPIVRGAIRTNPTVHAHAATMIVPGPTGHAGPAINRPTEIANEEMVTAPPTRTVPAVTLTGRVTATVPPAATGRDATPIDQNPLTAAPSGRSPDRPAEIHPTTDHDATATGQAMAIARAETAIAPDATPTGRPEAMTVLLTVIGHVGMPTGRPMVTGRHRVVRVGTWSARPTVIGRVGMRTARPTVIGPVGVRTGRPTVIGPVGVRTGRAYGDRPRRDADRPSYGDRPRGGGDRQGGERPAGDRSPTDRPPRNRDQPWGAKPPAAGERAAGYRPRDDEHRPDRDRPRREQDRSFDGRPRPDRDSDRPNSGVAGAAPRSDPGRSDRDRPRHDGDRPRSDRSTNRADSARSAAERPRRSAFGGDLSEGFRDSSKDAGTSDRSAERPSSGSRERWSPPAAQRAESGDRRTRPAARHGGGDRRPDSRENPAYVKRVPERGSRRREEDIGETWPELPEWATAEVLDLEVRRDLRGLSKEGADWVAAHLVAAGALADDEPEAAWHHARAARARGGRIGVVRETVGLVAYRAGEWAEAIGELRAARRMGGGPGHLAVMADCERALGHPERAIELSRSAEADDLDPDAAAELSIVVCRGPGRPRSDRRCPGASGTGWAGQGRGASTARLCLRGSAAAGRTAAGSTELVHPIRELRHRRGNGRPRPGRRVERRGIERCGVDRSGRVMNWRANLVRSIPGPAIPQ